MGEDVVVPTKCTDWSLNIDHESQKEFWWNSPHSISIWQSNVKVADPPNATDDVVWEAFLRYQASAVYKLCVVCNGPEQNTDCFICSKCGGTAHPDCATPPPKGAVDEKRANRLVKDKLCVCRKCSGQPAPTKPIDRELPNARRATIRALASSSEYPAALTAQLKALLHRIEKQEPGDHLAECARLVASHFQPKSSSSFVKKEPIASKAGGIGVVAVKAIPRFTVIGVYPGYEDPLSGEQAKCGRPGPRYSLVDLNCADYFNEVFVEFSQCFTPFINEPNENEFSNTAWIQEPHRPEGRLSVMTVRDIAEGEELLIGYGPLYPRTYPHNYDAYAYHHVDNYDDPPCFALWHWTTLEEKDAEFVLYCGYDRKTDTYTYWETEEEASGSGST